MTLLLSNAVRAAPHGSRLRIRQTRRLKPVRPSRKDELWYKANLLALTAELKARAARDVVPLLRSIEPLYDKAQDHFGDINKMVKDRASAPGSASRIITERIAAMRQRVGIEGVAQRLAESAVRRVGKSVDERVASTVRQSVGIDVSGFLTRNTAMQEVIVAASKANVGLIKSIPAQYFDTLTDKLTQGVADGLRFESLAKMVSEIGEVTDNRAKFIARDQVSKMNGAMTMLRQTSLGINRYTWQTSGDERVREEHAANDGQEFAWNDPPATTGHPGEDVNCRCVAVPLIDLDESEDGEGGLSLGGAVNMGMAAVAIGAYFGEWASAYDGKRAADAFNPDQPRDERGRWSGGGAAGGEVHATLTGNELGEHASTKELRKAAMQHAEQHLIGKSFTNANSGHSIKVTKQGMKHSLSGKNNPEVRLSVALPTMLEKAHYAGAKPPTEKHQARGVVAMHQYIATVHMGKESFKVGIVTHVKGDGHEHYDHAIVASGVKGAERLGRLL